MFSSGKFRSSVLITEQPVDHSIDEGQAQFKIRAKTTNGNAPRFAWQKQTLGTGEFQEHVVDPQLSIVTHENGFPVYESRLVTSFSSFLTDPQMQEIAQDRYRVVVTATGTNAATSQTVKYTFSGTGRGANNANIGDNRTGQEDNNANWGGVIGNLTTVGTNGGTSFYGTFDQGGQVYEWNDETATFNSQKWRGIRGGHCVGGNRVGCHINDRAFNNPDGRSDVIGFRLSSKTDPLAYSSAGNNFITVGDQDNESYLNYTVNNVNPAPYQFIHIGEVGYEYKIMKYPVTNHEYAQFLNAVDANGSNTRGLYHASMSSDPRGGITTTPGNPTGSKYAAKTNMGNKPVNFTDWFCAARFANWLHNKVSNPSVTGDQATETGAYSLSDDMSPDLMNPPENQPNALYRVPSESEWVKAGYYKGPSPGGTREPYWEYPTRNNIKPSHVNATLTGDGVLT